MGERLREVLEHNLPCKFWEGTRNCDALMSEATANINKDNVSLEIAELLFEWEGGEPVQSTSTLDGHDLLEVTKSLGLVGKPDKPGELGIEGLL
jgi:hypothetical protein